MLVVESGVEECQDIFIYTLLADGIVSDHSRVVLDFVFEAKTTVEVCSRCWWRLEWIHSALSVVIVRNLSKVLR